MLDFHESLTLQLPKISMESFQESNTDAGLIVEMAAIHHGLTANFNNYSADELEASITSWVEPYPKPIILNHDTTEDPIGRVMAAKMDKEDDDTPFIRLQNGIFKPEAVSRFADGRYLTGSVGGKVSEALCSVCTTDWAAPGAFDEGLPCAHERGKVYKGQLAYFDMKGIEWKEYSIVNVPADKRSGVLSIGANGSEDATDTGEEWVKARFFAVGLNKESVVELSESGETNILAGMKRKESAPIYHGLRGAYLVAIAESLDDEENQVAEAPTEENEDDVLAVSDSLSADLAADEDEATDDATDADSEEGDATADEDAADEADASDEDAETADADEEDEEDEESNDDAEAADQADEESEDDDAAADSDEEEEEDKDSEAEASDDDDEDAKIDADAGEESDERFVALEAEVARLTDENKRLRTALKRGLAERVVDAKIALGVHEASARQEVLDDHMTRTASSLADSLRDLAGMKVPTTEGDTLIADGKSGTVVDPSGRTTTTTTTEDQQETVDPVKTIVADAEDFLAELMLGHKTPTTFES